MMNRLQSAEKQMDQIMKEMESLREEMNLVAKEKKNLPSDAVLEISQQLDKKIVEFLQLKKQLKEVGDTH
ncbi:aspartyl-phosphate phosphatase Spo0E family protein [Paenibacillus sp. FSL L8-0463]|uniref:aspartyl-phosphate phosphatase Spo0E family protein n=1 Tax=Paenibacillus sp. FSL L8-0463 TaxID=2954687 RepID=UPI003119913A